MFAYMIQCHKEFSQVSRLLSWLYNDVDYFILCIDANSKEDMSAVDWSLSKPNITRVTNHAITWGGPSMVAAMVECISAALKVGHWQYFINVSGYDLPLRSRQEICSTLAQYKAEGYENFISDFGAIEFVPTVSSNTGVDEKLTLSAPSGARIELFGELCRYARIGATDHHDFLPVITPSLRPTFVVNEAFEGGMLRCRPYFPFEAELATRYFERFPYRFGRQWIVAGRRFCRYVVESESASDIYLRLSTTFIPDESFFQSVAATAPVDVVGKTLKNNLRYKLGGPEQISDDNFDEISSSDALFARKIVLERSRRLLDWADSRFPGSD